MGAMTDGRKALLQISVRTVQRDVLKHCEECAGTWVAETLRQELSVGGIFHYGDACRRCALRRSTCNSAVAMCQSQQKRNRNLKSYDSVGAEEARMEAPRQTRGLRPNGG